jgi:hypothetical protein
MEDAVDHDQAGVEDRTVTRHGAEVDDRCVAKSLRSVFEHPGQALHERSDEGAGA